MIHTRFIIAACVLLVSFARAGTAQERDVRPTIAELSGGAFVLFAPKIVPTHGDEEAAALARTPILAAQLFADDDGIVHRLLVDERGDFVFGYDLRVEPLDDPGGRFRVSARPLDPKLEARLRARSSSARKADASSLSARHISTLARATPTRIVTEADSFALDLLVNEAAAIKIVDHVKIARTRERLVAPPRAAPPRDFSITDVDLALQDFRLVIDGEEAYTTNPKRSCRGSLVFLELPGQGRFIFSLAPHEGYRFAKTATIENDRIVFEWQGKRYEWISREPIVAGGGTWRLWMLHDFAAENALGYTPPDAEAGRPSETERALTNPLAVIAERTRDRGRAGFGGSSAKTRMRVRIGGSNDIETLMPRRLKDSPR